MLSKCAAGRDRDWDYATEALNAGIVQADMLLARIPDLPVADSAHYQIEKMLHAIIASH